MIPRTERAFLLVLLASVALVLGLHLVVPEPTDWSDSFAAGDSRPYGSEVVRTALPDLFEEGTVSTVDRPPFLQLRDTSIRQGAYLFVTDHFAPDRPETNRLLEYVARGNVVFVAAHRFGGAWADTLTLSTESLQPSLPRPVGGEMDSVRLSLSLLKGQKVFVREASVVEVFRRVDSTSATVLGTVTTADSSAATFLRRSHGSGSIFLSTTPRVFTNVHALDDSTAPYLWAALSHLPAGSDPVWWDAYHKSGQSNAQTPLRYVLSEPSLRMAYVIFLVGAVLFVVSNARRRQRAIPIREAPTNATVEFVETLGRLAHRRGEPGRLAEQRIRYLLASIRTELDVQADPASDEWIRQVAERSGVSTPDVAALGEAILMVRRSDSVSTEHLQILDRRIQTFRSARAQ